MSTGRQPRKRPVTTRPSFAVESTVSDLVRPKFEEWLRDLEQAIPRVKANSDEEAVHDLRVALRRIRSLLRIVRSVFGDYHVRLIRDEFKRVSDATGTLRDEEVLAETIEALSLGKGHRRAIAPWLTRRAQRKRALHAAVVRLLDAGALEPPIRHLHALMQLPCPTNKDKEARKFSRRVVLAAQFRIDTLRAAEVDDVQGMHDLRIAYKRLRYAVEALSPALPPELRVWGQVAARFQKVLGNLHDQDVALHTVRRATSLSAETREAFVDALLKKRGEYGAQYIDIVGPTYLQRHALRDAVVGETESTA